MFIVNHGKKICYWSKGKLGTTSLRLMVPNELHNYGPWEIVDQNILKASDDVTKINWDLYKDYEIFCPIRSPKNRYYSGLLEDIFTFYRTLTDNKPSYELIDLSIEKDWYNTIDYLYSITLYDMSLGLSYHVSNWLNEIVYLYFKNLNVKVFDMSEWNIHYREKYNLEQPQLINENPTKIKQFVKDYFENNVNPYVSGLLNNYLKSEEEIYDLLRQNTIDYKLVLDKTQLETLKDLLQEQMNSFIPSSRQVFNDRLQIILNLL